LQAPNCARHAVDVAIPWKKIRKSVLTVVVSEQELAESVQKIERFHAENKVSKASEPFATVRVARTSIVPFQPQNPHVINHFRCVIS
jgi:hypothetical protein